jgi:hypothetical protein
MNNIQNSQLTVVIIAGTGRSSLFVAAGKQTPPAALRTGDDQLEPGEILSIARRGQTLHVVSGCAWITFDGQDMTLLAGQEMVLEPGADAAVVSALESEPLVYRIYTKFEGSERDLV